MALINHKLIGLGGGRSHRGGEALGTGLGLQVVGDLLIGRGGRHLLDQGGDQGVHLCVGGRENLEFRGGILSYAYSNINQDAEADRRWVCLNYSISYHLIRCSGLHPGNEFLALLYQ